MGHTSQVGLRGLAQIRQTMYFASQLEPGYCASWQTSFLPEATNSKYVQGQRAAICAAGTHQLRESSFGLPHSASWRASLLHEAQICTVWVTTGFALQEHIYYS